MPRDMRVLSSDFSSAITVDACANTTRESKRAGFKKRLNISNFFTSNATGNFNPATCEEIESAAEKETSGKYDDGHTVSD